MANFIISNAFGVTATQAVTGTPGLYIYGPPVYNTGDAEGEYCIYAGTQGATTATYAWRQDVNRGVGNGPRSTYVVRGF